MLTAGALWFVLLSLVKGMFEYVRASVYGGMTMTRHDMTRLGVCGTMSSKWKTQSQMSLQKSKKSFGVQKAKKII